MFSLSKLAEFCEWQSEIGSSAPQSARYPSVLRDVRAVSQEPGIVNEKRTRSHPAKAEAFVPQ